MDISQEDLKLEKEKLNEVLTEVDSQVNNFNVKINKGATELREFQKMSWETRQEMDKEEFNQFLADSEDKIIELHEQEKKVRKLMKTQDNPYFGSIVYDDEPIYIGINAVKKDMDYLVCDWRAPICSMFYDYGVGAASYKSPNGIEKGYISRKRQYKIEKGKLKHIFDTNINIDDEVLQDALAQTSSDKMKNIVNTIQTEQNEVIRDNESKSIIVQGIAGSGKTSVALHRIAFLLYKLEYLTNKNVLIFSPNNVFTEYISDVLPDLGEDNTVQTTFHEFASAFISEYESVESYSSFVERFYKGVRQDNELIQYKLSDDFIEAIEEFCKYYTKACRFVSGIEHKNVKIDMNELNQLLFIRYGNKTLFERVELIAEHLNNRYFKGMKGDYKSILSKLYKSANFKKDYIAIYKFFYESAIFQKFYPYMFRKNENAKKLSEKKIPYEDATPFIYMKCLLEGFPYQVAMREVVIDEAQDYTYLQYKIIRKIFKNANFTILGDVNQTVNPFYRYENLNVLLNIFDDGGKYIELNKTYRSSPEIIEYANSILGLNHVSAIRKTRDVPVIKRSMEELKHIGRDVKYLKNKYKSLAIITKSIEEAKVIADGLKSIWKEVCVIDINTEVFDKKLVVTPAYGAKGLEFDSVIIINNFDKDKYLYYVAATRAQHELIVYEK